MDRHRFGSDRLSVEVAADGAELRSLRTPDAGELLWQAGPEWKRHAPILFPIVGRLAGDTFRQGAHTARLTQHGFARDRRFRFEQADPASCRLVLEDDEASRAIYPFAFRLTLDYVATDATLVTTYRLTNPGRATLLASLGTHPAFRWPLRDGIPKDAHRLRFERDETGPVRRLRDGLLDPDPIASPIQGRVLPLSDALFAADAVILERPASQDVRYEAEGTGLAIDVGWEGFNTLGIWSKPGPFVCIEPWSGVSSPIGFDGDFAEKPGVLAIEGGATLERRLRFTVVGA